MKKAYAKKKSWVTSASRNIFIMLVLLALIAAGSLAGMRKVLLDNAEMMGNELAKTYSIDEERRIAVYQTIVQMGMSHLDEITEEESSPELIEQRIRDFFAHAVEAVEQDSVRFFAIIDGKILTARPMENLVHYDYKQAAWYEQVEEAGGEVVFTDAYESVIEDAMVVSVAAMSPKTGNVIVIDLPPESFWQSHTDMVLMEGAAYYLCDSAGKLLYYKASADIEEEKVEQFAEGLCAQIQSGEIKGSGSRIKGLTQDTRDTFYSQSPNGWMSILTVPHAKLMSGMSVIAVIYILVFLIFLAVGAGLWLRDRRLSRVVKRINDTIRILGNSYYGLYRLNLNNGTYEMVKGSEYIGERLPKQGEYNRLLEEMVTVMDEETGKEFAESFSLEHLRILAEEETTDFGGEFLRRFDDKYRWINVRLLMDESLSQGEMVLCLRQVEEEKQRQLNHIQLLRDSIAAAEASEKSRMQFFSNMSHDMRTPLNAIINITKLAKREDCDPGKRIEYLDKIDLSGRQLLHLINDILDIARLEQGKITLEKKSFDICRELALCAEPFREQAKMEGKEFFVEQTVENSVVSGDPSRLSQILNNLISNAMKFTKEGDCISVTLRQMDGQSNRYLFTVEDTGIGMSEEFLPKLFLPYERETRFARNAVMGTGLGMPIVKSLISQMGGQITVESALGKGSRFVVTLPFAAGEALDFAPENPEIEVSPDMLKGKKILLVDDNFLNLEIAAELLEERGVLVTEASDGQEAVEKFEASAEGFFDVILMDMQMPKMDGCEAARRIRRLSRADARTVPIIALTANAFPEDIARTDQAGMDAHLSKPIDVNLLCGTIEGLLKKRTG